MRIIFLNLLAVLLACQGALAAPLSEKDTASFRRQLLAAETALSLTDNPAEARKWCQNARAFAARFDPDECWAGLVEFCFADVEQFLKNNTAACAGYYRAAAHLGKAPKTARLGPDTAESQLGSTRRKLRELGC